MRFFIKDLPCTNGRFFFFKAWIDYILPWVSITPLGRAYSNFEFVFGIRAASSNFQGCAYEGGLASGVKHVFLFHSNCMRPNITLLLCCVGS